MVIAGVVIDEAKKQALWDLGVKDSKLLTPLQRERLYEKIIAFVDDHVIIVITPAEIDAALADENTNLNWLEAEKFAEAIQSLRPQRAVVDCPSNNIEAYANYVKKYIAADIELICVHRADATYATAAAGSILAKVTRDRAVAEIQKKIGKRFGSGYPSDPTTQAFLKKHWQDYPEIFRKSWASYKKVAGQSGLDEF